MAFEFSLAAVLRVRESLEKREERALQAIQLQVGRVTRQIEELSEAIVGARSTRELELERALSGGKLQSLLWEEQAAEGRLTSLMDTLRGLEEAREEQIKMYQAAHRDRELLTSMRGKQRELYDREWLRAEQKRLDDIFIARRHRIV